MTSAATRRRVRRQVERQALAGRRAAAAALPAEIGADETLSDSVYGYELRPLRAAGRARLRWVVDAEPFYALMGLQALQQKVLGPLEVALVADCRADGLSWDDVGFALGITGEGARKKHASSVAALGL